MVIAFYDSHTHTRMIVRFANKSNCEEENIINFYFYYWLLLSLPFGTAGRAQSRAYSNIYFLYALMRELKFIIKSHSTLLMCLCVCFDAFERLNEAGKSKWIVSAFDTSYNAIIDWLWMFWVSLSSKKSSFEFSLSPTSSHDALSEFFISFLFPSSARLMSMNIKTNKREKAC